MVQFRTHFASPYEQHRDRVGQRFSPVRVIDAPDASHDSEALPMYVIRFEDGTEIEAWPEEVALPRTHWTISKDERARDGRPWSFQHVHDRTDPHYAQGHGGGSVATFKEAVAAVNEVSWAGCGLALDQVPFYGLELGINTPDGQRTCALDVAGFRHLEEATAYAETLRSLSAEDASIRAEHDGHMVSPMDADDEDLHLPLAGATVYLYDDETTWSHDLLSWERPTFALTS